MGKRALFLSRRSEKDRGVRGKRKANQYLLYLNSYSQTNRSPVVTVISN